jgi:hypothetical protein
VATAWVLEQERLFIFPVTLTSTNADIKLLFMILDDEAISYGKHTRQDVTFVNEFLLNLQISTAKCLSQA